MTHYRTMLLTSARAFAYPDEVVTLAPPLPVVEDALPADPAPAVEDPKVEEPAKVEEEVKAEEPAKVEEEAKVEDEKTDDAPVVPEAYELKAPEGADLDPKLVEQATPVFKELGLTNEQAQKVVDLYAGTVLPEVAQTVQNETLRLLGMDGMADWAKQIKADPELGGANFEKAQTVVAQARDAIATPELRALLETTRLGNHPEVFKLFHKIGTAIGEGSILTKGDGTSQPASLATTLYGDKYAPKS